MTADQDEPATDVGLQTLVTAWPRDATFLEALHVSWIEQYADYIGEAAAHALVNRLLVTDELYPGEGQQVQLALIGTRPVGVAACRSMQGLSLITMLEVLSEHRQQGVGSRLLTDLQARTTERLFAHVSIHRPQVRRFYERQGFRCLSRTCVDHYGHALEFDVMVK
ncbi:GNAT family N-acetyltransferase [Granulosicoccus sp. 3-233]|uniref:GNAT family N-acetyltransferase n=1 Tax=Granulosicoccus sp. 3-233 TaxID=3417969 RepID=UPI003D3563A6